MKKLAFFAVCLLTLVSCTGGQQKSDPAMLQRVDSLNQIIAQKDNEINDMMGTFNEIEEGFRGHLRGSGPCGSSQGRRGCQHQGAHP